MIGSHGVGIDLVQLVTIPSTDQARSLAFYESLGFEVRADFPWGDGHRQYTRSLISAVPAW